uniref:Fibronectin type-III domain-containing protein n=1 Tax=Plectus sambesii TaxID=2011161 RepID=A0A914VTE8_9BILA
MEPIPEDRELPMSARTVASKSLLREVYTSEQVDTIVRTVPQSSVPDSWDFVDQPVDPEMASYYVTEPLGPSSARGSTYQYSYESHYDQPPGDDGDVYDASDYVHYADPSVSTNIEPNIERHSTQTQKVTRVTKVTTTRSVRQVPVAGEGTDDYYFDPDGNALPISGNHESVTYDENSMMALEQQMESTSLRQPPAIQSYDDQVSAYAAPGAPGAPQVVDVDTTQVTLVWLRPDYDGDAGPIDGYQVQVKRPQDSHWQPAHAGFIAETQCTISNLAPNGENQFRVLARNAAGLGHPSTPSPLVQLRPRYDTVGSSLHAAPERPGVPYPPGRPQVVGVDGDRALIAWDPPVVQTSIAPVAGFQVEYRVAGTSNWVASNDFLVTECRHEVLGLRPNGDYEFRVLARNADGLSEPSASSGL